MAIPKLQAYALPGALDIPPNKVNWAFEPERAALLIHDMQDYFVSFWGDNCPMMEQVIANIAALRQYCKEHNIPVYYTAQPKDQSDEDRALLNDMWGPGLTRSPEQQKIVDALAPDEADTVLVGTSMAANYRSSWIQETFGTSAVRLTIPDGYYSEFDQVMNVLFRTQEPERVIFGLDVNTLIRDESGVTAAMPDYLYNANPLDDIQYLLNKDTLYYSAYTLLSNHWGEGDTIDEGFTWDRNEWWNHISALENYDRPEIAAEELPADAYRDDVAVNLAVAERWVTEHPDTEFDFFLPPYSILFWDKVIREGRTEAVFAAIRQAGQTLLQYDNVKFYGYLMDPEIVTNLDNYCDYIHHSGGVCREILTMLQREEGRLTEENLEETLANWREFVVHYDYDQFWDERFWIQWNAEHAAAP